MEKYKIDFVKNTFTLTKAFEDKMQNFDSEEYKFYKKIINEIPGIVVLRRTHKTPTTYTNKDKETFRCNQFKNLTFERMEKFMSALTRSDEYMAEYVFIKDYAGRIQTNEYALVRKWFIAQFSEFRKNPWIYFQNEPELLTSEKFFGNLSKEVVENTELDEAS